MRKLGKRLVVTKKDNNMTDNKRQHERVPKDIRLPLHKKKVLLLQGPSAAGQVSLALKGKRASARIMDISKGGVRVATDIALQTGDLVLFVMRAGQFKSINEIEGEVVWVRPSEADTGFTQEVGVRFTELTNSAESLITRLLAEG